MDHVENSMIEYIETYRYKIKDTIEEFVMDENVEDMRKASQNVWTACLYAIRRRVFPVVDIFKSKELIPSNSKYGMTTGNIYNYSLVNGVCDLYLEYCSLFDKIPTIQGFSHLTGIHPSVIYNWKYQNENDYINNVNSNGIYTPLELNNNIYNNNSVGSNGYKLSYQGIEIYKKLVEGKKESLESVLVSGKRNPMSVLPILNHDFDYSLLTKQEPTTNALSVENLPKLCAIDGQKAPETAEQKQVVENAQNTE